MGSKDDANKTHEAQVAKRDQYAERLSDRTRTSCLGALAIIWGIFSEKKAEDALGIGPLSKKALLFVAFFAIVTLTLDFAESAIGYIHRNQLAGHSNPSSRYLEKKERFMLRMKLYVGVFTLLVLCILLSCILAKAAFAQDALTPFIGKWCGGDWDSGEYVCLKVGRSDNYVEPLVEFSYQGRDGWIDCTDTEISEKQTFVELTATCGRADVEAWQDRSILHLWFSIRGTEFDRELLKED